jgi:hypothetical protein
MEFFGLFHLRNQNHRQPAANLSDRNPEMSKTKALNYNILFLHYFNFFDAE